MSRSSFAAARRTAGLGGEPVLDVTGCGPDRTSEPLAAATRGSRPRTHAIRDHGTRDTAPQTCFDSTLAIPTAPGNRPLTSVTTSDASPSTSQTALGR